MVRGRIGIGVVWAAALAAAVVIAVVSPAGRRLEALPLVLAMSVVLAFALQLLVGERDGFTARVAASCVGALAIVLVVAAVALI